MGAQRSVSALFGIELEPPDGMNWSQFTEYLNERLYGAALA